jgi:hypothetical protein
LLLSETRSIGSLRAATGELPQERGPECFGFGGANVHAKHIAAAMAVDAHPDNHRNRDDTAVLAHLHVGGVDPQMRAAAVDRPGEKAFTLLWISAHSSETWLLEMPLIPMA